jgi:hypothetical protein
MEYVNLVSEENLPSSAQEPNRSPPRNRQPNPHPGRSPVLAAHAQVQNNARELAYTHWRVIFFWASLVLNIFQFTVTSIVLAVTRHQTCDMPLRSFLSLYALATLMHMIVMIWHYKEWDPQEAAYAFELETTNLEDNYLLAAMTDFSNFFTLMTYILGNIWVFGCKTCQFTSPALFYLSLTWVIFGYVVLMLPVVFLVLLIFCLPLFIFIMRVMYPPERRGASDQLINTLPEHQYTGLTEATYGGRLIDKDDAECAICLGRYEIEDPIRVFQCKHHFHKECVDRWLGICATCPLCVRPVFPRTTTGTLQRAASLIVNGNNNLSTGQGSMGPTLISMAGDTSEETLPLL